MHRMLQCGIGGGLLAIAFALLTFTASAHESRDVADGHFHFVVGFLDEPAYSGEKNGLDLRVSRNDPTATPVAEGEEAATTPVEGLDATLQAEVFFADQSMPLVISASFGEPGAYESVFFPTQPGDYSFHIFGTIEGVAIDETFTSGPETFGPMEDPASLQFPKQTAASSNEAVSAATVSGPAGGDDDGFTGSGLLLGIGAAGIAGLWILGRMAQNRRAMVQTT